MRLMKRILSVAAVLALSASLLVGCSSGTASSVPVSASSAAESTVSSVEETASSAVDENEAAAAQLLNDLTGSYQELWPAKMQLKRMPTAAEPISAALPIALRP